MTVQQSSHGPVHSYRIDSSCQLQNHLGLINVGSVAGEQRVEGKSVLQRRQWPNVADQRIPVFPDIDVLLRDRHQRNVGSVRPPPAPLPTWETRLRSALAQYSAKSRTSASVRRRPA